MTPKVILATVAVILGLLVALFIAVLAHDPDEHLTPFASLDSESWDGFNFELAELAPGEAARLTRAGVVLSIAAAEGFARKELLATEAKLRGEPVLVRASVLAAYETQQPFDGLAWAFDFEADIPFSGGGMPVDGSLTSPRETGPAERTHLLILVDAKSGVLLAVAAVGLP